MATHQAVKLWTECKICTGPAEHFFICDFHANTNWHHGFFSSPVTPCGKEVEYVRCPDCGFIFTTLTDQWTQEQFRARIYNKDYPHLDNDYLGARGAKMANLLWHSLNKYLTNLTFLDYGGGYGTQTDLLKRYGAKEAVSYDPFTDRQKPENKFDVVTCSEVLEHSVGPVKTINDLASLVKEDGIILATTLLVPSDIDQQKANWWYISPRVGHVSFYTKDALALIYRRLGMNLVFIGDGVHMAYRKWTDWAKRLLPENL